MRKLGFRNKSMVYPEDSITCHGVVTGFHEDGSEALVECDLWIENQDGERVVQPANALVRFPRRND